MQKKMLYGLLNGQGSRIIVISKAKLLEISSNCINIKHVVRFMKAKHFNKQCRLPLQMSTLE